MKSPAIAIPIQERYALGPYKGYFGQAERIDDELIHGEVLGLRDVVTFQAIDRDNIAKAFTESIDDYLAFCKAEGVDPEKPFSGKFVARFTPELHRQLSINAMTAGTSLNKYIVGILEREGAVAVVAQRVKTHPTRLKRSAGQRRSTARLRATAKARRGKLLK